MEDLIKPAKYHRTIDGTELAKAREKTGMSQAEFAARCGWSQQFQSQLEYPEEKLITVEKAEKIMEILGKKGLTR